MTIELVLETTEIGCIIPTSHKLNPDGYFRKNVDGKNIMYHRHVWLEAGNMIPKGHEIDHMCRTRACCNIEHLRCLSRNEHLVLTNERRYADRKKKAKEYWEETFCNGLVLANEFGVTFGSSYRWIREWEN